MDLRSPTAERILGAFVAESEPNSLPQSVVDEITGMASVLAPVREEEALFDHGQDVEHVFLVRSGLFMGSVVNGAGVRQVTEFYLPGEFLDVQSFCTLRYESRVVALTTSSVIAIPLEPLLALERDCWEFQECVHQLIGRAIERLDHLVYSVARKTAAARVAAFYLDLSERFGGIGQSRDRFQFPASHADIASFLMMTGATFSRAVSDLHSRGLIRVKRGDVMLPDRSGLRRTAGGTAFPGSASTDP